MVNVRRQREAEVAVCIPISGGFKSFQAVRSESLARLRELVAYLAVYFL